MRGRKTHHDIQPSKRLNCKVDCRFDFNFFPYIRLRRFHFDIRVTVLDERSDALGGGDVQIHEEDVCAFRSEEYGGFESDTAVYRENGGGRDAY